MKDKKLTLMITNGYSPNGNGEFTNMLKMEITNVVDIEESRHNDCNEYIGIKTVNAQFLSLERIGKILNRPIPNTDGKGCSFGYLVTYPDGYQSYSPKDVFEEAYIRKEEINIESDTIIESLNKGSYFSNIMIKVLNSMRKN